MIEGPYAHKQQPQNLLEMLQFDEKQHLINCRFLFEINFAKNNQFLKLRVSFPLKKMQYMLLLLKYYIYFSKEAKNA